MESRQPGRQPNLIENGSRWVSGISGRLWIGTSGGFQSKRVHRTKSAATWPCIEWRDPAPPLPLDKELLNDRQSLPKSHLPRVENPVFDGLGQLMHRHRVFIAVIVAFDDFEIGINMPVFIAAVGAQLNDGRGFGAVGRSGHRAVELPAAPGEIMGDTADRVVFVPEIAASVVIEIHRQAPETARHELAESHGAGPGAHWLPGIQAFFARHQ